MDIPEWFRLQAKSFIQIIMSITIAAEYKAGGGESIGVVCTVFKTHLACKAYYILLESLETCP